MTESKYTAVIGAVLGHRFSHVRQTLRSLREAGLIPGRRLGDLKAGNIPDVIMGLTSPTFPGAYEHVRTLRVMPRRTPANVPSTVFEMLRQVVNTLPKSPVLGDLDLDDGYINIAADRVELECLSLSGRRCVVRYGADETVPATTIITRIPLNGVRALAEAMETK